MSLFENPSCDTHTYKPTHTSPPSSSHTHLHTSANADAVWPLGPSRVLLRRLYNGHVEVSARLQLPAQLSGCQHTRAHSQSLLRKQRFPSHTLLTPPLRRPRHDITQLIQRVAADCRAPVSCIKPTIEQLHRDHLFLTSERRGSDLTCYDIAVGIIY